MTTTWSCDGIPKDGKTYPSATGPHVDMLSENYGTHCQFCGLPKEAIVTSTSTENNSKKSPSFKLPKINPQLLLGGLGLVLLSSLGILAAPKISNLLKNVNQTEEEIVNTFIPYYDQETDLTIIYPNNWDVEENDTATNQEKIKFLSPLSNQSDLFREQVTVKIEQLNDPLKSLNEYGELVINNISSESNIINLTKVQPTTIANREGRQVTYTNNNYKGHQVKVREYWILQQNSVYVITYIAEVAVFEETLPTVEKMIDSLEIIQSY